MLKNRMLCTLLLLSFCFLASCTKLHTIRPTELGKLRNNVRTWRYQSSILVNKPDGKATEVVGPYDVVLQTKQGVMTFLHPVQVRTKGRQIMIQGANRKSTALRLHDISRANLRQTHEVNTALAVAAVSIVGACLLAASVVYATKDLK